MLLKVPQSIETQAPPVEMEQETQMPSMDMLVASVTGSPTLEPSMSQTNIENQMR